MATAVSALDDIFVDFPFASDADRTTLFAAIITQVCRRSYAIAPMFMFDKPKSGTGATLLSQLVSLVTTGKMPKRITYSTDILEFEKRATATLRQNNGVVLLDNLNGNFSSSMIAEMVTAEDDFEARELGVSRNIAIDPRNFVIHATANNVSMDAELTNRTMPLRLDARLERPDHRDTFKHPKSYLTPGRTWTTCNARQYPWRITGWKPANRRQLEVKGTNDQIRRANLSKKIKGLVGQTFEFDDVTVQLQMGPRYGNRYDQFSLQPIEDSLHGLHGFSRRAGGSDGLRTCGKCGHRLLPDEPGPTCENCAPDAG